MELRKHPYRLIVLLVMCVGIGSCQTCSVASINTICKCGPMQSKVDGSCYTCSVDNCMLCSQSNPK